VLPIVDLGRKHSWTAQGGAQLCWWMLTIVDWVLTTAVVAGVTNALKGSS
jgi:hypothetical protein